MNNDVYSEENHFKALEEAPIDRKYDGYTVSSTYITVRDGVKIAADIHLPEGLSSDNKIPCVLIQTRYWRATRFRIPFKYFIKPGDAGKEFLRDRVKTESEKIY